MHSMIIANKRGYVCALVGLQPQIIVWVEDRYQADKRWKCATERNADTKSNSCYDCKNCCCSR